MIKTFANEKTAHTGQSPVRYIRIIGTLFLVLGGLPSLAYSAGFVPGYAASTGDLNGDGLTDVYVKPKRDIVLIPFDDIAIPVQTASVAPFVLQRNVNQTFQIVSDFSPAQRASIAQWPVSTAIEIKPFDVNRDKVADAVLTEIPGANAQIVYADVRKGAPPVGVRDVDSALDTFLTDVHRWISDPARVVERQQSGLFSLAELASSGISLNGFPLVEDYLDETTVPAVCTVEPGIEPCFYDEDIGWIINGTLSFDVLEYQTSFASQDAFNLTRAFDPTLQDRSVVALTPRARDIAEILSRVLAREILDGVLRCETCPVDGKDYGLEIILTISRIASSTRLRSRPAPDFRYLTVLEKAGLAFSDGLKIRINNIDDVKIYNRGFLGLDGEIIAPDGNIYIGRNNKLGTPYLPEYTPPAATTNDASTIVHELVHVLQVRNQTLPAIIDENAPFIGFDDVLFNKILSLMGADYCYAGATSFSSLDIETQAEIVQDQYRLRNGLQKHLPCNRANSLTLVDIERIVPN